MTDQHTPGPWDLMKLRDEPGWRLTPPDGRCVCFGVLPDEDAEDDANARLIAAAPELLAALESLFDTAQSLAPQHQTGQFAQQHSAALLAARAAIAKAKGTPA